MMKIQQRGTEAAFADFLDPLPDGLQFGSPWGGHLPPRHHHLVISPSNNFPKLPEERFRSILIKDLSMVFGNPLVRQEIHRETMEKGKGWVI